MKLPSLLTLGTLLLALVLVVLVCLFGGATIVLSLNALFPALHVPYSLSAFAGGGWLLLLLCGAGQSRRTLSSALKQSSIR